MKITVNNIDMLLRSELNESVECVSIDENPCGVFLQWTTSDHADLFSAQTEIIEKALQSRIPVIVFDKNMKITSEEAGFLVSNGVFLWEPAINGRNFFSFQPVWGKIPKSVDELDLFNVDRPINLGCVNSLSGKIAGFEQYYLPVAEYGKHTVAFFDRFFNPTVNEMLNSNNIPILEYSHDLTNIKNVVLLGSANDYKTGVLDSNIFNYLENGVVPLLPCEHRWYHSIFGSFVMNSTSDVKYMLDMYDKTSYGIIYEIYQNLNAYMPECDVENVAKRILTFFS